MILEFILTETNLIPETNVEISSDTGNGFLGYTFLRFLTRWYSRFQKRPRLSLFPPRHAGNPSDAHGGTLSTGVDRVKLGGQINTLEEFASVSASCSNTYSYMHQAEFDDPESILAGSYEDILAREEDGKAVSGIRKFGQVEFVWTLQDGTLFSQHDICRAQTLSGGDDWEIFDLDESRPSLCARCSNQAQVPLRHTRKDECPLIGQVAHHQPEFGIRVTEPASSRRKAATEEERKAEREKNEKKIREEKEAKEKKKQEDKEAKAKKKQEEKEEKEKQKQEEKEAKEKKKQEEKEATDKKKQKEKKAKDKKKQEDAAEKRDKDNEMKKEKGWDACSECGNRFAPRNKTWRGCDSCDRWPWFCDPCWTTGSCANHPLLRLFSSNKFLCNHLLIKVHVHHPGR